MDELNLTVGNLPVEADPQEEVVECSKVLHITPVTKDFDFQTLLGQVVQYVNMGDILAEIKAGTQYVVQIPAQFQAAYESGELFIMQNQKSGKTWPTLMRIAEDGRQQVVTPLPITEQAIVQGNPIQELASSQHNLLMQQQMARLSDMIETTYRAVERIEHGQMDDRIGLLEAGKNGLILAMTLPEGDERNRQIDSSRQNLLVAQAQIGETLKRRAREFEALPKSGAMRFAREVAHTGYLAEKRREVQEMQEYYDWDADAIEERAQNLADQLLRLFPIEQPVHKIEFKDPRYAIYTVADPTNATYKHVNYYELLGERVNVDSFAFMVRSVAAKLYDYDASVIETMARNHESFPTWQNPVFSFETDGVKNPVELKRDSGIYISTGYSAYDCICFIRALLKKYNLDIEEDFSYSARPTKQNDDKQEDS